jgi:hypothetical protein
MDYLHVGHISDLIEIHVTSRGRDHIPEKHPSLVCQRRRDTLTSGSDAAAPYIGVSVLYHFTPLP